MTDDVFVHESAEVAETATVGPGTRIWHQAQVMGRARIGRECTLGKGVYIDGGCVIGDLVKLGNYASVFGGVIESEAFIGPGAVLATDPQPRSTNPDGTRRGHGQYVRLEPRVGRGASIGANAVVLPGVTVGEWAMVAASSLVNRDVPPYTLVAGNPARAVGHVCRCGTRLGSSLECAVCGRRYETQDERLHPVREA